MAGIIVLTEEQLQEAIYKGVSRYFSTNKSVEELPDTVNLDNAQNTLEEFGFSTSKAKLYKLTSTGNIPHRKYGNKLIFSRKELIDWAKQQLKDGTVNMACSDNCKK